jgi:hypothetical protein
VFYDKLSSVLKLHTTEANRGYGDKETCVVDSGTKCR